MQMLRKVIAMTNRIKVILALVFTVAGCALVGGHGRSPHVPKTNTEFAKASVMVVNSQMNSGGTGVILDSHIGVSHVLTNKHVCQLIQTGGHIITDDGETHSIDGFRVYKKHDLCLLETLNDLGVNIKVANEAPKVYDTSVVVGHPALLPTIFTLGHFSQRKTIDVMVDVQRCDGTEQGEEALACMFMGGKPVVKRFQSQVTSSLIMPGSSGSPVYNEKGELSALVFAGSQGLSYGFLVPWEYIHDFLGHKNNYKSQIPDSSKPPQSFWVSYFKFQELCDNKMISSMTNMCNDIANLGIWHE